MTINTSVVWILFFLGIILSPPLGYFIGGKFGFFCGIANFLFFSGVASFLSGKVQNSTSANATNN